MNEFKTFKTFNRFAPLKPFRTVSTIQPPVLRLRARGEERGGGWNDWNHSND